MRDQDAPRGWLIRARGLVQGVGFRPMVWRLAKDGGLAGDVCNDGAGVLIHLWGPVEELQRFRHRLYVECPPLARIDSLEVSPWEPAGPAGEFRILASGAGAVQTGVVADAATCAACLAEIRDPTARRYRYPFTNCTHCGPRLSIISGIPYDRANTSMAGFPLCPDCAAEYEDPADRRFHAQPIACPRCGPQAWLEDGQGRRLDPGAWSALDALALASRLLAEGRILAIKGIGGFHLAVDAENPAAVAELRRRKRRQAKPFALMARDPDVIRRYAVLDSDDEALLRSPAAPILLLPLGGGGRVAGQVAPGQDRLGFMLPYSPLHHLLLADWVRPLVMTSGNLSEEPQCIDNADAAARLGDIADYFLLHNRPILNRLDDSVLCRMAGAPRFLRRARGQAPAPLPLPPGFGDAPPILALGGELKTSICLLQDGQAIMSQHLGDLEDARTAAEYERTLELYLELFQHRPRCLVTDLHPDYRSTRLGRELGRRDGVPVQAVQHHFAHVAAVLGDNDWPLDGPPVLGIALDGLGYGADGSLWGGEFLQVHYRGFRRLGHLRPVAMPGASQAIRQPWRNCFAQLDAAFGWDTHRRAYPDLPLTRFLESKPLDLLSAMVGRGINSPLASSCGRLFDAVAAALDLSREGVSYEGQAAIELEVLARGAMADAGAGYPLAMVPTGSGWLLDPASLWPPLLADLARDLRPALVAARFLTGLIRSLADLGALLAESQGLGTVALSGGVTQNQILLEGLTGQLVGRGLKVLLHRRVPANDGGLALGQALIVAAGWDGRTGGG